MKFKHFAIIALLTATVALFTSCAKDEDPTEQNPTVNFKGGAAYVSADATLPAGSDFTIGINAASNTESNAKLVKFTVVRTFNNLPTTVLDSTMDASSLNFENTYQVKTEAGAERWTFEVTDKDGNKSSVSLNITTGAVANVYTAILMGGQLNTTVGSFWSSVDNKVMKQAEAITNQNKVDFLYFYGTVNQATIASVMDDQAAIAWNNLFDNWTVKNATLFKKVTGIDWNAINEYNAGLIADHAVSLTDSRASLLAADDIVAFETAATSANPGKKGLFKVTEITGTSGTDRTIKIEVKIMK